MTTGHPIITSFGIVFSALIGIWLISVEVDEIREQNRHLAIRLSEVPRAEERVSSQGDNLKTTPQISSAECDRVYHLLEEHVLENGVRYSAELRTILGAEVSHAMKILERLRTSSTLTATQKYSAVKLCVKPFAEADPEVAMDFVFAAGDLNGNHLIYGVPLRIWLRQSPEKVLRWFEERESQLPEDALCASLNLIAPEFAPIDPEQSIDLLVRMSGDPMAQIRAAGEVANQLETEEQFRGFYQTWSKDARLSDETRKAWFSSYSKTLLSRSLVDGPALVESLELPKEEQRVMAEALLENERLNFPEEWLGWLAKKTVFSESHLSGYLDRWATTDYRAYGNWLNREAEGELRELGIERYVKVLAPHDPEAAEDWIKSLKNAEKKKELLERLPR